MFRWIAISLAALGIALAAMFVMAQDSKLSGTSWKFVSLRGAALDNSGSRTSELVLSEGEPMRYSATIGCNRITGDLELEGTSLAFGMGAATRMACPAPLDTLEQTLTEVLQDVSSFEVSEGELTLFDASGAAVAHLVVD